MHTVETVKSATRKTSLLAHLDNYITVQEEKAHSERLVNPTKWDEMVDELLEKADRLCKLSTFVKKEGIQADSVNWIVNLTPAQKAYVDSKDDPELEKAKRILKAAGCTVLLPDEVEASKAKLKGAGYRVVANINSAPSKRSRRPGRPLGSRNKPKQFTEMT